MSNKTRFNREAVVEWLISLRTCRFEHPAVRRPLTILRYVSMAFCFVVFALALAVALVTDISAFEVVAVTTIAFVIGEAIYYAVRAYLLRNLKLRQAKKA